MELFLTNLSSSFSGRARRETLNGREYVVCSVVMIVPGVLTGSRGPLLYPEEEVSLNVELWNGMPLTARHPTINGEAVSARRPEVANKFKLGEIYNVKYDGRLTAEAWFDIELTRRIDNRIVQLLESGKKIEISTGLYTKNTEAPAGSVHNGTPYTHVATNYRPDHLAVLMDETGACSLKDGCGLNVNQTPNPENSVNKEQLVAWLTANCACWKGPSAGTALNALTEPELTQLKTTAEASINLNSQLTTGVIVNGAKVTVENGQLKATQIQTAIVPTTNNKPIELTPVGQPVENRTETFIQLLDRTGTPQEKEVWNTAVQIATNEKSQIVDRLVSHITDATAKANAQAVYNSMPLPDLRKIAPPAATPANNATLPNYQLGAGGPLPNLNVAGTALTVNKVDGLPATKLTFNNPLTKKVG